MFLAPLKNKQPLNTAQLHISRKLLLFAAKKNYYYYFYDGVWEMCCRNIINSPFAVAAIFTDQMRWNCKFVWKCVSNRVEWVPAWWWSFMCNLWNKKKKIFPVFVFVVNNFFCSFFFFFHLFMVKRKIKQKIVQFDRQQQQQPRERKKFFLYAFIKIARNS